MEKKFNYISKVGKRKIRSDVTVCLRTNKDNKPVFTVCGHISGHYGQCLEEIAEVNTDFTFLVIYQLWKKYHCNDCHYNKEGIRVYKSIPKKDLQLIHSLFNIKEEK